MTKEELRELLIGKYQQKTYIGDGAYISFDGYHFILSTERENGIHWIGLEPPVIDNFLHYRENCYNDFKKLKEEE